MTLYAPPPQRIVAPQPAVIVGIGGFGCEIIDELKERQRLHARFETAAGAWLRDFVQYIKVPGDPSDSAVEGRKRFLQEAMPSLKRDLLYASRQSRQHARQPHTTYLRPRLLVVGATWEPTGCALLWPVGALVQQTMAELMPYDSLGLFVSANFNEDQGQQDLGDAHTFVVLSEGDALLRMPGGDDWRQDLMVTLVAQTEATCPYYEHVFLVDSLKQNNAEARAENNPAEAVRMIASLLEALLFTPTYSILDNTLLEDFPVTSHQVYVGVGTAALMVPLRELEEVLRDQSIAHLIRIKLLPQLTEEEIDHLRQHAVRRFEIPSVRQIRSHTMATWRDGQQTLIGSLLAGWRDKGLNVEEQGYELQCEIHLGEMSLPKPLISRVLRRFDGENIGEKQAIALAPMVHSLNLHSTESPFSEQFSLTYADVLLRLQAEQEAVQDAVDAFDATMSSQRTARHTYIDEVLNETYWKRLNAHLGGGDSGLSQSIVILEQNVKAWDSHHQALQKASREALLSAQRERLRDATDGGERRWYYEKYILGPPLKLKPRLSSLALRGLLLIALLYQFYWSALDNGHIFPPLEVLGPLSFPAVMQRPDWEWILLGLISGGVLLLILFLYLVPTIALHLALRFHRHALASYLKLELNRLLLENAAEQAQIVLRQLQDQLDKLLDVQTTLQQRAAEMEDNLGETIPMRDYLEYKVVTPSMIVSEDQLEAISQQTVSNHRGRVLASWHDSELDDPVPVMSAEAVIETLQEKVQPLVKHLTMKPVADYLHPDDYPAWFRQLWESAVPWIKTRNGLSLDELPVDCNVLLLTDGPRAPFAQAPRMELERCHVESWFDPYRILFLRLQGGIPSDHILRRYQFQQAFQLQPDAIRMKITDNSTLLEAYPSTLPISDEDDLPNEHQDSLSLEEGMQADESSHDRSAFQTALAQVLEKIEKSIEALLPETVNGEPNNERIGLVQCLVPLYQYIERNYVIDKPALVSALVNLDSSYPQMRQQLREGLTHALDTLDAFLKEQGIGVIAPAIGEHFDVNVHEAVEVKVDPEALDGVILQLLRRGYYDLDEEQLLSAAQVVVNKLP